MKPKVPQFSRSNSRPVLWKYEVKRSRLYNELPFKFEAGTPDYIGTTGLAKALDYVNGHGIEQIAAKSIPMAASVAAEDTLKFTEFHSMGATYAVYLKAVNATSGQSKEGWVSCGSFMFPYKALRLSEQTSLVMPEREPQRFVSVKGMLVRVQQSELMMSMVEALGGQSVATAYSEVYSALQTGVVDAAENSIVNYLDQSHFEVAPYFVEDHHTRSADILVMGEKSREKLSAEDLKIIDDTALESWEYQKELWAEAEEESKQKLLEQDVTITELTEEELKAFQDACEPIWYSYEGGAYKDIIDQIVEAGK